MPEIGSLMLKRGHDSADVSEGEVSIQIIKMRIAIDYPIVPKSTSDIVECYLRWITFFHASTTTSTTTTTSPLSTSTTSVISLDNSMDLYWIVPLLYYSGLPVTHILLSLMQRFHEGYFRRNMMDPNTRFDGKHLIHNNNQNNINKFELNKKRHKKHTNKIITKLPFEGVIEIVVIAGHLNSHPIGLTILHRLLTLNTVKFHITIAALPLIMDSITDNIKIFAYDFLILPLNIHTAWVLIESLEPDIVMFPDWQPFPDQQSLTFMASRAAPVQVVLYTGKPS